MTLTPEQLAKSDAEFEAMMADKYPFSSLAKNTNGHYVALEVWHLHRGWMLRHESMIIDLPFMINGNDEPELFWSKNIVLLAIQSAGINYREKE